MIRFAHFADLHLDAPFREAGRSGYSRQRREDIKTALERILQFSRAEKADFVLSAGDLYEHLYTTRNTIAWVSQRFSELSMPIVMIAGNHDPYVADSWYRLWPWPSNVVVLSEDRPGIFLEAQKTFIYGLGFSARKQGKPDLNKVPKPKEGCFNILMLHGTVDMDVGDQDYSPVSSEELADLGYDYYALGHFHTRKSYPTLKNAFNPGSPEPLGFDEPGDHGFLWVEADNPSGGGDNLRVKDISTAARRYSRMSLDISDAASSDELKMKIAALLEGLDPDRDIIKLSLKGRTSLVIDDKALHDAFFSQWLNARLINDSKAPYDYEALSGERNLKGAFTAEMLARIKACPDEDRTRILKDALILGLEALETGRIESLKEI